MSFLYNVSALSLSFSISLSHSYKRLRVITNTYTHGYIYTLIFGRICGFQGGWPGQLGTQRLPVADDVWSSLLCRRNDAFRYVYVIVSFFFWRGGEHCSLALLAAAVAKKVIVNVVSISNQRNSGGEIWYGTIWDGVPCQSKAVRCDDCRWDPDE